MYISRMLYNIYINMYAAYINYTCLVHQIHILFSCNANVILSIYICDYDNANSVGDVQIWKSVVRLVIR